MLPQGHMAHARNLDLPLAVFVSTCYVAGSSLLTGDLLKVQSEVSPSKVVGDQTET